MNNSKIIVLIGKSSTGKSTILNKLVEKYNYHNAISCTTRLPRQGETDKVDYNFLSSNEEFDAMYESGQLLEKTEYFVGGERWCYGLANGSISDDKTNVVVLNPHGVRQLLKTEYVDRVVIFEIMTSTDEIIQRYWCRSDQSDKAKVQFVDRLLKDADDFDTIEMMDIWKRDNFYSYDSEELDADEIADDIVSLIGELNA